MSLRPDHVEGAARASGAVLSPASRPFSTQISSASEQIGLQCRETRIMLEQNGPAMEPRVGHMGNVGLEAKQDAGIGHAVHGGSRHASEKLLSVRIAKMGDITP